MYGGDTWHCAKDCFVVFICIPRVTRLNVGFRGLQRQDPRGFFPFLVVEFTRDAVGDNDRVSNEDRNELPPSEVLRSPRENVVVYVDMLRDQSRLIIWTSV